MKTLAHEFYKSLSQKLFLKWLTQNFTLQDFKTQKSHCYTCSKCQAIKNIPTIKFHRNLNVSGTKKSFLLLSYWKMKNQLFSSLRTCERDKWILSWEEKDKRIFFVEKCQTAKINWKVEEEENWFFFCGGQRWKI